MLILGIVYYWVYLIKHCTSVKQKKLHKASTKDGLTWHLLHGQCWISTCFHFKAEAAQVEPVEEQLRCTSSNGTWDHWSYHQWIETHAMPSTNGMEGIGTVIHWEPHFLEGKNWMFWSMERVSWIDPTRGTWCLEYPMRQINSKSVGINGDPWKDSHCLIWLATRSRILMTWPDSDGVHWQTWTLGNNMFVALPCFAISSLLTQWFSICLGIEDHWNNFIIVYHEYAPDNSPDNSPDTNHYPIGAHQLLKFAREPEDSEPSSERMPLGRRAKAFQVTQKNVRNTLSWW